jgi:hypothetical protein
MGEEPFAIIYRLIAPLSVLGDVFAPDPDRKLVWNPSCGPDLIEFTRDLASGPSGIFTDIHFTKQAKRHYAVGIRGMRGKAPDSGIGLGG